ncbi:MAG: DUF2330 domain-containing protein [Anaerolineae bacterium]|nr:DUF2330 domain-containing protein [Anaerolineae bacterium]
MTRSRFLMRFSAALVSVVACACFLVAHTARADGYVVPLYGLEGDVDMPAQKAIIVYDSEANHEDLILSVKLLSESPEAAWVVPVPSLPEVRAASTDWFVQLSDLTQPLEYVSTSPPLCCPFWLGASGSTPVGVEVVERERVGLYDVSTLSADDPAALLEWLADNGYAFPEQGGSILETYVRDGGWHFVAARVLPEEVEGLDGDVHPLWLSFDAQEPVYPMRLTALAGGTLDVLLYVLADHRMDLDGFETEFAGELTLMPEEEEEEGALVSLLTDRPYFVTRLRNTEFDTQKIVGDLYPYRAPNDDSYRKITSRQNGGDLRSWLMLSLLAGMAVAVWRLWWWRH